MSALYCMKMVKDMSKLNGEFFCHLIPPQTVLWQ